MVENLKCFKGWYHCHEKHFPVYFVDLAFFQPFKYPNSYWAVTARGIFRSPLWEKKKQKNFGLRLVIYVYCWTSNWIQLLFFNICAFFASLWELSHEWLLIDGNTLRRLHIVAQHFMTFYVCRPWNCVIQNVPVSDGYLMTWYEKYGINVYSYCMEN